MFQKLFLLFSLFLMLYAAAVHPFIFFKSEDRFIPGDIPEVFVTQEGYISDISSRRIFAYP
ncbi:MAG: hypothetical protein WB779_14285 [Ignavibacteriaceae bacterium]